MLTLLAVLALAAPPTETQALVQRVEARYVDVDALRAKFVQTTRSELYGDETQTGTIVVARPDRLRWTFDGSGKVFVSDGKVLWAYSPADKQVVKYPNPGAHGASADVLLQSLDKLSLRFVVSVVSSGADGHVLALAPKPLVPGSQPGMDRGELFKELQLGLDAALVVRSIRLTDPFGTVTELELSAVELDVDLATDTFAFQVPPGVEVLDAGS